MAEFLRRGICGSNSTLDYSKITTDTNFLEELPYPSQALCAQPKKYVNATRYNINLIKLAGP